MPLPGGASDKAGLRYELLWTVRCLIRLMKGELDSIWLEPAGEEGEGVEFAITTSDGLEYHQVKRQLTGKGVWSLSELSRRGVLSHFYQKLGDSSATCTFVSSHAAHPLDELAARAREARTWTEFQRNFVSSDAWDRNFNELHTCWNSPSTENTYERLTRVEVREIDEKSLREWVEDALEALVTGVPATASAVLSSFALNQTHQELTSQDVWAHLQSHRIDRLTLRQSDEVIGTISELKETYIAGIRPVGIGGEVIPRNEVSQILATFDDDESGNVAFVTGKAGVGKSSVIAQALEEIEERGWPILTLKVDPIEPAATPRELGKRLGLPASPASTLANLADGNDCLFVIDQLDAVSLASGRNPEFFDCIGAMLNQAKHHPNMRVLVASRKFDVDNDHRIRELISANGIAQEVPLAEFDEVTVKEVVANLGIESDRLNPKQIELLSLPVHLRLLAEVSPGEIDAPLGFQTAKELYDAFWDEKKRVLRERVDATHIQGVADLMAKSMSERQTLSVPISLLDKHHDVVDLMASENILVKDGARVSFFHESFFDYIFARRMVESNFDAVQFIIGQGQSLFLRLLRILVPIRKGQSMLLRLLRALLPIRERQSLFVRSQIRQVLLHQRDVYPEDALGNMAAILQHTDIRTHLKGIVLALLGSLDDPTEDEWAVLESMHDTELSDHVWRAINGSSAWFDVLDSIGVVRQWLASDYEQLLNRAVWFLRSVQEKRADKVAELLSPFINVSDSWNQRLTGLIVYSEIGASRGFFDFALKAIREGLFDRLLGPNGDDFGTWHRAEQLAESEPEMACELVAAFCERLVILMRSSKDTDSWNFLHVGQDTGGEVMEKVAASVPKMFTESLIPFLDGVLDISANKTNSTPRWDPVWASGIRVGGKFAVRRGLDDGFILAMESSLRWLATNDLDEFRTYAQAFEVSKYAAVHNLLMRAYEANGRLYANEAVKFLLADLCARVLASQLSATSEGVVESLIKSVTPHCSPENLTVLEKAILEHYPDNERGFENRRWWGASQMRLLECVDSFRISDTARRRLQELHRKFGESSTRADSTTEEGGFVRSPIPKSAVPKMSNDDWLNAMSHYSSDSHTYAPDDWLKGGASELSRELESKVKENPARFARLIHKMPDDSNINYFEAILRGLAKPEIELDMDLVVSACLRCDKLAERPLGQWITQPLTRFPDAVLPDKALELIAWYATEHPNPEPNWSPFGSTYHQGKAIDGYRPLDVGINSVRGRATVTLANLIFHNERYMPFFNPYLWTLVSDHSDAVRACAAEALLGTLRYDRDLAVNLFLDLCDADERLLVTHYFERFLYYAVHTHFKELEHILTRMVESGHKEVATVGARQTCLASLSIEDALPLAGRCVSGSVPMRIGAAEVYANNIRVSACRAECEEMLGRLFSDEDKDVRDQASRCFIRFEGNELRDYSNLVKAYIGSSAFEPEYNPLINALSETTANMPSETLFACERYFELAGTNAGDVTARVSANSSTVIALVIRVYGKATNDEVKSRCLDLIDKAILLGAYGVDSVEATFDR